MKTILALIVGWTICTSPEIFANPMVGGSAADGDVTLLSSYNVPAELRGHFESEVKATVDHNVEKNSNMWLMYEEFTDSARTNSARYFTVHFPHDIDELTEPSSATIELVSVFGGYRAHTELTRQVPDWCSTTSLDATKLPYAYVEYLWLIPNSLDDAGRVLAKRGDILRSVYGAESNGNAAAEGFVAMVAPFQVMHVLFSSESSLEQATEVLRSDLKIHDLLGEWDSLDIELTSFVSKRRSRYGKFRPALSVDY